MAAQVTAARAVFLEGRTRPQHWRKAQLQGLLRLDCSGETIKVYFLLDRMYDENESLFCEALAKDLRKPKQEALSLEVRVREGHNSPK